MRSSGASTTRAVHAAHLVWAAGWLAVLMVGCVTTEESWKEDRSIPFSPDDRAIAYRHRKAIFVARSSGDRHRQIYGTDSDALLSSPHWAPDRRGLVFAVSPATAGNPQGPLSYALWFWPAPREIWDTPDKPAGSDTNVLPERWDPASTRLLAELHCRHPVQIQGDALFEWHPDGTRILCLDTAPDGRQHLVTLDIEKGTKTEVAPVAAASLAFNVSPDGKWIVCAAADTDASKSGLWLGPCAGNVAPWRCIEEQPGPTSVPVQDLDGDKTGDEAARLYDLRPRLAKWSYDSRWTAHLRQVPQAKAQAGTQDADQPGRQEECRLVVTAIGEASAEPQVLALEDGTPSDLHWAHDGLHLGFLLNTELHLIDAAHGQASLTCGAVRVDRFLGWSATGKYLAYVTPQASFREVEMPLPAGYRVVWEPTPRHHLVVAQPDGTVPESRFSGMNIAAARWAEKSHKLSFWATYLPTVNLLPPGDPAAVLDLDDRTIKWFPTDVEEYAQAGHYYLLNDQYEKALETYQTALEKLGEGKETVALKAQLDLWIAVCHLGLHHPQAAAASLAVFRESFPVPVEDQRLPPDANTPPLPEGLARELAADRVLLATLLSMNQVELAARVARQSALAEAGPRGLQAACFTALIQEATATPDTCARYLLDELIPRALDPRLPATIRPQLLAGEVADRLVEQVALSRTGLETKTHLAKRLAALSRSLADAGNRELAQRFVKAAALVYRDLGDTEAELAILKTL